MDHSFTYQATLAASERVNWRVEDLIGGDRKLDFGKAFLPESLARVEPLAFLSAREKLLLNQIRGNAYLHIFGLVEEFILPFVLDHARPQLSGDDYRVRALLRFAGDEAKHIHLFKRFSAEFRDGFGFECEGIGPGPEIARAVLAHHPLAVALTIAHIEWMTQRHYLDSVLADSGLDAQFKNLLKHHWMEESQHTKLDTLIVESVVKGATPKEIDQAFEEYCEIGMFLDNGIKQQAEFEAESFVQATGRKLSKNEREEMTNAVLKGMRWTYLGTGMTHPNFLATVEEIKPEARKQIEEMALAFS